MHALDLRYGFASDSFLAFVPFFHSFGLVTTFIALALGQRIIVLQQFTEDLFLKSIQDYMIPCLWCAPAAFLILAKSSKLKKYDLSSLTDIICAGAPLDKELEETLQNRLRTASIRQTYGLTETTASVITVPKLVQKPDSCGKIHSYMVCKIRDPKSGRNLQHNQIGELSLKGPMIMNGYYRDKKATREVLTRGGWFRTGDLGYYEMNRFFYIIGRSKDIINHKSYQFAPAGLETILLAHPKIEDAAVVGQKDETAGEVPVAFVVKTDEDLNEAEVVKFVSERDFSPKWLHGRVRFVSVLPKNPIGNVLRQELQKMLQSHAKL